MIHQPKTVDNQPPSEARLILLLKNGMVETVEQFITYHKLPYRVEKDAAGNLELKAQLTQTELWLKRFITVDKTTLAMKDDARKLSACQHEVLITGETGTGKEIIAQSMIGERMAPAESRAKFIAVNCAGLPETLIEAELFGYIKGAFTGADNTRAGLMSAAQNGVLFLDEIGELPMSVQAKLLRALQDKKIRRVGDTKEEEISCKFVCATHRNIKKMVDDGQFRKDLYARISTFDLHINPLRERDCDIEPITNNMIGGPQFLSELSKRGVPPHKLDLSLNVRSLRQYVERWNVLGKIVI